MVINLVVVVLFLLAVAVAVAAVVVAAPGLQVVVHPKWTDPRRPGRSCNEDVYDVVVCRFSVTSENP